MHLRNFSICAAALAFLAASPAVAAVPAKPANKAAPAIVTVSPAKSQPDFGAMLAIFDKLFPPQPDPDPVRMALARTSVQALWPDGAYGKMMVGLLGGAFDRVMLLKQSDLGPLGDKTQKSGETASDVSIHDKALAKDPYFDQRVAAIRQVLNEEAAKASTVIDPRMRDGLARAMARRFDTQQLADINTFFATPTGRSFASQYIQLWIDPDMMRSLAAAMPQMMALMPEAMQKLKAANDKFPKPPEKKPAITKGAKH